LIFFGEEINISCGFWRN